MKKKNLVHIDIYHIIHIYIYKKYIYNGILCSHEKNEIMPSAATWMDLETITLRELSHAGKHKYNMILLICEP